jgi:hypothetical protein
LRIGTWAARVAQHPPKLRPRAVIGESKGRERVGNVGSTCPAIRATSSFQKRREYVLVGSDKNIHVFDGSEMNF